MERIPAVFPVIVCVVCITSGDDFFPHRIRYDRSSNDTVRIAVILPNSTSYLSSIIKVGPSISLAIGKVKHRHVLPGWKWNVRYLDSKCNTAYGTIHAVSSYIEDRVHLFLGPVCDYVTAPVARLLKFWDIPLLTGGALARDFGRDKSHYDTEFYLLTRVGLSFNGVASLLLSLFRQLVWRKLFLLYDSKARIDVINEDYCVLWTKALVEYLRKDGNFTWKPYMLPTNVSYEGIVKTLTEEIAVDYGVTRKELYDCVKYNKKEDQSGVSFI